MYETKRFYVYPNLIKDPEFRRTKQIIAFLRERGAEILLPAETEARELVEGPKPSDNNPAAPPLVEGPNPSDASPAAPLRLVRAEELSSLDIHLCLVIGGDGTILSAIHRVHGLKIPIVGVNLGNVGYLAEVELDMVEEVLTQLLRGEYQVEERFLLEAQVGEERYYAANEFCILRPIEQGVLTLETYISGTFLTSFQADGLIISTPTGSTGHSFSAGGPIMSPESDSILLTPMCSVGKLGRSVVLPAGEKIRVLSGDERRQTNGVLTGDGKVLQTLETHESVVFEKSDASFYLAKISRASFYEILQKKLK